MPTGALLAPQLFEPMQKRLERPARVVSTRTIVVLMAVVWVPASLLVISRHSAAVEGSLRQQLVAQLQVEQERSLRFLRAEAVQLANAGRGCSFALHLAFSCQMCMGGLTCAACGCRMGWWGPADGAVPRPKAAPSGWPLSPQYDTEHRAYTPYDLDAVQHEDSDWVSVCTDLMARNQELLETSALPQNVTLVSGIWDMGRDAIVGSPSWQLFRRPFSHYTDAFKVFLKYQFPKVVYLDEALFAELKEEVRGLGGCGPCHERLIAASRVQTQGACRVARRPYQYCTVRIADRGIGVPHVRCLQVAAGHSGRVPGV
jgi:hypothetical protein